MIHIKFDKSSETYVKISVSQLNSKEYYGSKAIFNIIASNNSKIPLSSEEELINIQASEKLTSKFFGQKIKYLPCWLKIPNEKSIDYWVFGKGKQ